MIRSFGFASLLIFPAIASNCKPFRLANGCRASPSCYCCCRLVPMIFVPHIIVTACLGGVVASMSFGHLVLKRSASPHYHSLQLSRRRLRLLLLRCRSSFKFNRLVLLVVLPLFTTPSTSSPFVPNGSEEEVEAKSGR